LSSSQPLRAQPRLWHKFDVIQPGKVVAWVLSDEEGGWRMKR
jgi:hypothetical protein